MFHCDLSYVTLRPKPVSAIPGWIEVTLSGRAAYGVLFHHVQYNGCLRKGRIASCGRKLPTAPRVVGSCFT